jgi:hypothetical protein
VVLAFYTNQIYQYYAHPSKWSEEIKLMELKGDDVDMSGCLCRNCEKDLKVGLTEREYVPRWRRWESKKRTCLVPDCSALLPQYVQPLKQQLFLI